MITKKNTVRHASDALVRVYFYLNSTSYFIGTLNALPLVPTLQVQHINVNLIFDYLSLCGYIGLGVFDSSFLDSIKSLLILSLPMIC